MDLNKSESSSEDNSKVAYSFPNSENANKLDFPVRDRYLQKISTIGIDPVLSIINKSLFKHGKIHQEYKN